MTDDEDERLYVMFSEMNTEDLIYINFFELSVDELEVLADVMDERSEEIQFMIQSLEEKLETLQQKKQGILVRVPDNIVRLLTDQKPVLS